ncbi:MAG: aminodeoxychorismate synthase component I [Spongiibacteraceae bacterium]
MPSFQKTVEPLLQNLAYTPNSAHWFARVRDLGTPVWFDSAWPFSRRGRYDIISAAPLTLITSTDRADFIADVRQALDQLSPLAIDSGLPFHGGAITLLSYEYGRQLHSLDARDEEADLPAALAGIYSWAIVSDHEQQRTTLIVRPETPASLRDELTRRLHNAFAMPALDFALNSSWQDDFPAENYRAAFARLQEYIRAGDCYQVNLARRFRAEFHGDPFTAYLRLREIAAAPYSAYFEHGDDAVLCLSPERLIAAKDCELLTQPIKGTAPRDNDPTRDRELAQQLQSSEKNRAENLMIVDLLRNDLGRSCKPGSIRVEQLFELQSFATVHHLVSSIRGELRDEMHALDALKNSFPGGSITGAPKHRAMQIIDELEPHARSIFCGSIGYIDRNGNMDTNITIRTLLASRQKQTIYAWAGGGVVADSKCEDELQETNNKIDALLNALEITTQHTP